MLLTHNQLMTLIKKNVIENVPEENVNAASIDLTLGSIIHTERTPPGGHGGLYGPIELADKENIYMEEVSIEDFYYDLYPGEFILAQTQEIFHLPNTIAGEFKLKSSAARNGLDHHLAGWCDPGWHGSVLTLEFKNNTQHHVLRLRHKMKIGQIVLWQGEEVPSEASYASRGQYNGDLAATQSKGIK